MMRIRTDEKKLEELKRNEKIAYDSVPTQEEMLTGGQVLAPEKNQLKPGADQTIYQELEQQLSDAAAEGNIGGD